jgi:hypothetical protein
MCRVTTTDSSAVADGVVEERVTRGNSIMLAAWGDG